MKGRTRREKEGESIYKQQACSPPLRLFSSFVLLALLSEVPLHVFSIGGSAGNVAPAASHHHHPGGGGAMLCQSSYAGPHTTFLLISPSLQSLL